MKKILLLLTLLILLPITTHAASDVEIKDLSLVSKTNNTEVLQDATYSGLKIKFNLKFSELGDNAIYKFTIKNNSNKDYEIDTGTSFGEDGIVKYEFKVDGNSKVLKAKESKTMNVTISYNKQPDPSKYQDGKYIAQDTMNIQLSNNKIIVNPKTANSKIIFGIIIMIIVSTVAVLIYSQKQTFLPFVILLLLIPVTTLALEKITINVDSKIEIVNNVGEFDIRNDNGNSKQDIPFEKGMTFAEFLESEYSNYLTANERENLSNRLSDGGSCHLYFADTEIRTCLDEATSDYERGQCVTDENKVYEDSIIQDHSNGCYYIPLCK